MDNVRPASFGGFGRQMGIYGGIEGVEFAARCPPDIQQQTRVVAVCGIPESAASPQEDGWFYSDFFLFFQMLCPFKSTQLPNQLWLCSAKPEDLIEKYDRYLHGPANGVKGDRRVVMDKKLLPTDAFTAGFRVLDPKVLLERFLATLKQEIQQAAKNKQPVLVLIFGHGEQTSSGIFIGCDGKANLKLTEKRLVSVLQKDVPTTFVMTSCFSGGWVMKPNFNKNFDKRPIFNHSFLTAAGSDNPSLSWSLSRSVGRQAAGSVFASALLSSIITASEQSELVYSGERVSSEGTDEVKLVRVQKADSGEELSISMAGLTRQIVYECEARFGSLWEVHNFSFAAQDDLWEQTWQKRTGLPTGKYKERWESLPEAPLANIVYPSGGPMAGSARSRSPGALYNIVKVKATEYMNSHPGADNAGCNTNCHPGFHKLVEGVNLNFDQLYCLNEILDYRQGQLGLAQVFCHILGLGVTDGQDVGCFDEVKWTHSQLKVKKGSSRELSKAANDVLERFNDIRGFINRLEVFDPPDFRQGYSYSKPAAYLAFRLAETSMPIEQIRAKLDNLLQYKLREAMRAALSPLGVEVLNQTEVKTMRGRLYNTASRLKHRLRSLSPRKSMLGT